jgi:hypothetical protein
MRQRFPAMVVVAVGAAGPVHVPGTRVLVAQDAADAAARWNAVMA